MPLAKATFVLYDRKRRRPDPGVARATHRVVCAAVVTDEYVIDFVNATTRLHRTERLRDRYNRIMGGNNDRLRTFGLHERAVFCLS